MFKPGYVPKKYNIFYGGTGSSKSFSIWTKLIEMCVCNSTFDVLIARKYATTLKNTVEMPILNIMTKSFKNIHSSHGLVEGRDFTYNKTLKHIKFASGSIIRMTGYDNPEKLKGIDNVNVLVLEEVTDFTQEDLEDIQDRLRGTPPDNHAWGKELKIFMMFNPIFKTHWIRTYFFKDEIDMSEEIWKDTILEPDNTFALKTTWRDNKYYNGQYKDEKLREKMKLKNPRKYGVQCNGNWGVLGELIFENWKVIECNKDLSYYDDISYGLDWGFEHATSFGQIAIKDGELYVLKEFYKSKLTITKIVEEIKRIYPSVREEVEKFKKDIDKQSNLSLNMQIFLILKYKYAAKSKLEIFNKKNIAERDFNIDDLVEQIQNIIGPAYTDIRIYADSARPEAIKQAKDEGLGGIRACTKGPNSVLESIEWLQDRAIYVDKSCTNLINELESYQWEKDKKTGERLPKPIKVNDDAIDGILRYGSQKFRNPNKFRLTILG